ncbi:hypothetical protein MTO96_002468 [Rhipicephalus appendiculatus]
MQGSEEVVTKQADGIPLESSSDSPTELKHHSDRSGRKKAAKMHKSSRRASRRKRHHPGTTEMDDDHAETVELEATGQTASDNPSATSSTKAPTLGTHSQSQQQRSRNQRSSPRTSGVTTATSSGHHAKSLVSHGDKVPATELKLPTGDFKHSNSKNGRQISSDVKGPRAEAGASPSKEAPGSTIDNSCKLWQPPSLEDHRETPSPSKAAYADKRRLPGSTPPSGTLDCESDQQFPKLEISLTEIINADLPSVEASKGTTDGRRQAQEGPSTPSQRSRPFAEFGSQDATLLSRSKSFLAFWRLASSEGCSTDSPRREKSRRPGTILNAVWELTSSVDLSEDPCKDFYGFACGRWANASSAAANDAKHHDSYMAIQRRAYVTAVNAILLKARRGASSMVSGDITQHIAGVYRSGCPSHLRLH